MKFRSVFRRGFLFTVLSSAALYAQAQSIVMSSTTSTEQSGLFAHLLPAFKKASGLDVKVVALGTGQALDMARRGDADVVFVHDQVAEERFVTDGFGLKRVPVMYNDFVLIGPKSDPAKIAAREAEYKAKFANPFVAGRRGYIDDVILPHETRKRISRSLAMLKDKVLTNPPRKHGNIPL